MISPKTYNDDIANRLSSGTGLLTSDSSSHFVFQIQKTDVPALESASTALASASPACTLGASPLIERDDPDAEEEITCLANTLIESSDGLMNPNGLMSIFRTQIVEVAQQMAPDFVPIFNDARVAGAFGLFLVAADTILPILFPGLAPAAWLMAGFIAFGLTMLPLASNTQGKIQQASGVTAIVLQVTKGKSGSGTEALCPPADQPYDCASSLCAGNANNICTGVWSEGCPCSKCPAEEDMVKFSEALISQIIYADCQQALLQFLQFSYRHKPNLWQMHNSECKYVIFK